MSILELDGIAKGFGGMLVLDDIYLHVDEGEAVGLVGPNGAGKTTLFNIALGNLAPDRGNVSLKGRDVTSTSVYTRARMGVGRTFQRLELFGTMTPREHLLVAGLGQRRPGLLSDLLGKGRPTEAEQAHAQELLELVGLEAVADQPIETLSLGLDRMVELGRALMSNPELLLLDEPSSGLDRSEAARFAEVLEGVRESHGTAVLFVEHDLDLVRRVVDRMYVLDAGIVVTDGETEEVIASPQMRAAYLGATTDEVAKITTSPHRATTKAPTLLELRNVDAGYDEFRALFDVSLSLETGTVTALLGSNGAGKTTVARVASGLVRPTSGQVLFEDEDITKADPFELARRGILHVPEGQSVFASLSVNENLELSFRALYGRDRVAASLNRAYELFPRLAERRRQLGGTLSGGERRMLALARAFPQPPRLLIADELSLGLAPRIVDEVFEALAKLRDEGTTVLIVEQHATKALELADDVVVLTTGEITYQGPVAEMGDIWSGVVPE